MRLDSQVPFGEFVVALIALLQLMAAKTALRIAGCLDRVDVDKIASVAAGRKIAS